MALDPLQAVRDIALGFPEAVEKETAGHPTYRVRDKVFVGCGQDEEGRTTITVKAVTGEQGTLLAKGDPYFLPKYVGSRGWVGVRLDDETDWRKVHELIIDSYREIAPGPLAMSIGVRSAERSRAAAAFVAVGGVIGELVEGKPPKDQQVAEDVQEDADDGPRIALDPDDPGSSTVEL
ncbi:MmcQ/YjbR family DNA-binding protein [Acidimicrobiia bacterium EGI L10123]|uniref:MmcQ/YjbR family DNA-binding protein n=1 Tax=Salinilacustrithrix flava TaxID=2957203 RepID=UPI003D7C1583|nr:MmcQ/YjbR family DNA-binding protein [Acidimicrobiia bacterium EGI L10123]